MMVLMRMAESHGKLTGIIGMGNRFGITAHMPSEKLTVLPTASDRLIRI